MSAYFIDTHSFVKKLRHKGFTEEKALITYEILMDVVRESLARPDINQI